jgi:hypothetical protein
MSSLLFNDLALVVNKRTIRNLAISRDHQFEQSVGLGVFYLDAASALSPEIHEWHDRGLEHPDEQTANVQLVAPRLLYATSNNQFGVIPGSNDLERLLNRLKRYDAIAPGPIVETLPVDAEINGFPLNNPCPITFKADPDRRFTFLRTEFFADNAPSFLDVVNNGLVMTIVGTAYRGDLFSRNWAQKGPTHDFEMKLRYEVEFVNDSDLNLSPVPFVMVADPPAPTAAENPSLPAKDMFIFARQKDDDDNGFVLPALVPDAEDPNKLVQPNNLVGRFVLGQLDDQIYETEDGEPVYRVEARSESEPQRFVIRKIGDNTILAEARAGRMVLRFKEMLSLDMTPNDVSDAEKTIIGQSLCKIHPTLAQAFTCDDIQGNTDLPLNMLTLLGATSLDIPIMPRSVVVPVEAVIVTADNGKPGPLNSVWSEIIQCDLDTARYFADPNADLQSFGIAGTIDDNTTGSDFVNFANGADFAIGISQPFMQPMLNRIGQNVMQSVIDQEPPGLDSASLQFNAFIGDDVLRVTVTGSGTVETPWPLPNVDYDFTAKVKMRFRAQKAVFMDGNGKPRDRFNCLIPEEVLTAFGLDIGSNRLELPNSTSDSTPDRNPLCFQGYNDPNNGIACFNSCTQPTRPPPPVFDADVNEIIIDDPDNPPEICDKGQRRDDPQRLGQATFDPTLNPDLKHDFAILPIPPVEDEDVEVDVDVSLWDMIVTVIVGAMAAPVLLAIPVVGPIAVFVLLTGLLLMPFVSVIASAYVTAEARADLADRSQPSFSLDLSPTSFLSMHLDDPAIRKPYDWESVLPPNLPGAFITRYHVVVQTAGPNEGT